MGFISGSLILVDTVFDSFIYNHMLLFVLGYCLKNYFKQCPFKLWLNMFITKQNILIFLLKPWPVFVIKPYRLYHHFDNSCLILFDIKFEFMYILNKNVFDIPSIV